MFLHPNFTEDDNTVKAILHIMVDLNSALMHKKLTEVKMLCWIQLDTGVMDKREGKSLSRVSGPTRAIDIDKGQLNFHQDLVSYDKLEECLSKSVELTMKATFFTASKLKTVNCDDYLLVKNAL